MFEYISVKKRLFREKAKNRALADELEKTKSDLDYISMMTGIDLDDAEGESNDEV